jgi:lipoyl(octanoyl) transferase
MKVENLGLVDYMQAYKYQLSLVENVLNGAEDTLIVCSHPSVVTLGKKSSLSDLQGWQGPVHPIERGGQATYHGPGQVIIYPVINLKHYNQNLAGFLESMEQAMVEVVKGFSLEASGNPERGKPDYTGVWVNHINVQRKVASIGVAVKKWITYHGLALNIDHDPLAFKGINPCGFSSSTMTSLAELTGKSIHRPTIEKKLTETLILHLQRLSNK